MDFFDAPWTHAGTDSRDGMFIVFSVLLASLPYVL